MLSQKKIGFWSVTSLVAGSQIGSGIFLLPSSLAFFGAIGLLSWILTTTGALLLALVFARLCAKIPKTGGPHAYIEAAFGRTIAFYSAWTYWVISWMSSTAVIIAVVGYLTPIFGNTDPITNLFIEILILFCITLLNSFGVRAAGRVEFLFTVLKILPLIIVPIAGIFFIKMEHFIPFNPTGNSALSAINAAALLTLWGFIGVESATTPAGSVSNPTKTIPRAIIFGTLIVSFVYIFNSFVIMGVMQPNVLLQSKAPFSDAAALIFGGNWSYIISLVASIVCLGTLNAWILTSGQIALGAASDRLFPKFFARKNKKGAPILSLITSSIGMIPLLILTLDANLINQVNSIIDISVTAFLLVYLMSVLSYLKLFCNFRSVGTTTGRNALLIGILALIFCGWALWASGLKMISLGLLITLSGAPIYLWNRRSHERDSLSEKVG